MRREIKKLYKEWSSDYDKYSEYNVYIAMHKNKILPLLNLKKLDKVLDLGCGTGRLSIQISKKVKEVVGVDFSKEMLNIAKEKSKQISNIYYKYLAITKKLPFKDKSFDKILSILVVNHIKRLDKLLKEIYRLLKPRGIFVFDTDAGKNTTYRLLAKSNKFEDYIYQRIIEGKKVEIRRNIPDFIKIINNSPFEHYKLIPIIIDPNLKQVLSKTSYQKNKGKRIGTIFILRKK